MSLIENPAQRSARHPKKPGQVDSPREWSWKKCAGDYAGEELA